MGEEHPIEVHDVWRETPTPREMDKFWQSLT